MNMLKELVERASRMYEKVKKEFSFHFISLYFIFFFFFLLQKFSLIPNNKKEFNFKMKGFYTEAETCFLQAKNYLDLQIFERDPQELSVIEHHLFILKLKLRTHKNRESVISEFQALVQRFGPPTFDHLVKNPTRIGKIKYQIINQLLKEFFNCLNDLLPVLS